MPIYEANGYRRGTTLTKEQRHEALAAIYGLDPKPSSMTNTNFSADQIEQMRALLAAHDANNRVGIKEFDLNNPPKEPYFHQEFPCMVYHHGKRKHQVAQTEEDLAAALEAGWQKEPFPAEVVEHELDEESAREAAVVEAKLRGKRK